MAGASLTIEGGRLGAGTVTGGLGANGGGNGDAFGGGLFLQGDESVTLTPVAGRVERILGVIADQTGSGGTGTNAGAGSLVLDGAGALDLTAANTFTGGTTIEAGVLELAKVRSAGSGAITFGSTSGEIEYGASAHLANAIAGFGGSDEIDFAKVNYAAGDSADDNAGTVSIETSAGATVATFKVSGTYTSSNFNVGKDASGDVLVTYAAASAADLLGGYAAGLAEPSWAQAGGATAFESWALLGSSAGADPGGFGFHGAPNPGGAGTGLLLDGSLGGAARGASTIGPGWSAVTGHGPGPSG
jgi:autotransporter-associated beta strand protein